MRRASVLNLSKCRLVGTHAGSLSGAVRSNCIARNLGLTADHVDYGFIVVSRKPVVTVPLAASAVDAKHAVALDPTSRGYAR